jgi:type IV secretion system protein VirB1
VASVESHFNPFAVRDNTARESWTPHSLDAAASIARERLAKGHSVDIGLMQINSANFAALGMTVDGAFDACHSLAAAHRILLSAFAAGTNEIERQAALLIALSRYNTGKPLTGIINGYANEVIAAQSASSGAPAEQNSQNATLQWDVWGATAAETTQWVVTADRSSKIERAGAQTSDARNEGRAPASSSEKGEPYELSAFQESEPSKP